MLVNERRDCENLSVGQIEEVNILISVTGCSVTLHNTESPPIRDEPDGDIISTLDLNKSLNVFAMQVASDGSTWYQIDIGAFARMRIATWAGSLTTIWAWLAIVLHPHVAIITRK